MFVLTLKKKKNEQRKDILSLPSSLAFFSASSFFNFSFSAFDNLGLFFPLPAGLGGCNEQINKHYKYYILNVQNVHHFYP